MKCPKCKIADKVIRDDFGAITEISQLGKTHEGLIYYEMSVKGRSNSNNVAVFTCVNPECNHKYKATGVRELYEEMQG